MRIGEIGGRHFAMELVWTEIGDSKPQNLAKEVAADLGATYYTALKNADGNLVCGTGQLDEGDKATRRPLYSFVDALCMLGRDAIYLGHVEDVAGQPQLWYAVIHGGCVSPGTDVSQPASDVVRMVDGLARTLNLPILGMSGEVDGLRGVELFDPEELLGKLKPKALKVVTAGISKPRALLATGVLIGAGVAAYIGYSAHKQKQELQAAMDAEAQATASYVAQVRLLADQLPANNDWLIAARAEGLSKMPGMYAGWELGEVTCSAKRCEGDYKPSNEGYNYQALVSRFGTTRVNWRPQDRKMLVNFDLQYKTPARPRVDAEILSPKPAKAPSVAVMGLLPKTVPNITARETSTNLSGQFSAPGAAGVLWQDEIHAEGTFYLDADTLRAMSTLMDGAGFTGRQITFDRGSSNGVPKWQVIWTRLRGDSSSE